MSMPRWITDELDHEHVDYRVRHHRPRFTAQEVAAEEHVSGHRMAKVVVVKADERLAFIVLPASQRVDLDAVRQSLGCHTCRLASEQEIAEHFHDCEVGAIPPLRHWRDVPILADQRLMQPDAMIIFQAGTHEDAIEIRCDDWKRIAQPREGGFAISAN